MHKFCTFDNDRTSLDFKMYYTSRKMKALPNIKIDKLDIGSKSGLINTRVKISDNVFVVTFESFGRTEDLYNNIRDFVNYLNPMNGERKVIFSDEPNKHRYALLANGGDIDYFYTQALTFGKFELEFIMSNPFTFESRVKKYCYTGKNGATAKIINNGGSECPLLIKVYAPKGVSKTKYQEDHSNITYYGTWAGYSTSYCDGGSSKYANGTGSYAELRFTGTSIKVFGLKSAGKGIANIYIDGDLVGTGDCYAPSEEWKSLIFSKSGLSNSRHTIKVEVAGKKNDSAVGYQVNIDYFEVTSSTIPSDVEKLELKGEEFNYSVVPTISNVRVRINNEYVTYKDRLTPTDELIIDTDEYTMELNGYNCLRHWRDDFPVLKVGENIICVEESENRGALVIFEFSERWL